MYEMCKLQEYVLVSTQQRAVEVYRRASENLWTLHTFGANEQISFASIEVTLPMATIYEYVRFPEDEEE